MYYPCFCFYVQRILLKTQTKKQGKKFGRPKVNKPSNWNSVIIALDRGEITAVEAMKKLRLKKTSFYKLKNADKNAEMK